MEIKARPRFYIDCTHTYFEARSDGISRVTRMLVEMGEMAREMEYGEVHPVVFCHERYYILPTSAVFRDHPFPVDKAASRAGRLVRRGVGKLLSFARSSEARRRQLTDQQRKLRETFPGTLRLLEEAGLSGNDFLVVPEFFRDDRFGSMLELKKRLKLAVVVHDLIPITHPEYCGSMPHFNEFAKFTAQNADLVVAVSRYSAACFEAYEKVLELAGATPSKKRIAWFHPGCDLNGAPPGAPSAEMDRVFSDGVPVYLVCGTIEPRKNHLLILKTFQRLWAEGREIKLLFVGRYGWRAEETWSQMTGHPELNRRFFWFSGSSDADLGHASRQGHAVICASHVEGFGLPLVEGLAAGRQVIFSRIKSFAEIVPAEFLVNSFDPESPEELRHLVQETLAANDRLDLDKFKPATWRQAAKEFYRILAESAGR